MKDMDKRILITGGHGMVGTALFNQMQKAGYTNVLRPSSDEVDFREQKQVELFFRENKPDVVIAAAAKVGGIQENLVHPAEFITDNAYIEINTIKNAYTYGVSRLIMICSSSIYAKNIINPAEDDLLNGRLDESNEGYSLAKLFGVQLCRMYRKEYGVDYCCVIPCNLYGPYDRFQGKSAHVVPALINKFQVAKEEGWPEVKIWGTGDAMREFMYVFDLAQCCYQLLQENKRLPLAINIGSGEYIKICELAELIKGLTGYTGDIIYDSDKPEGQFIRKMKLDTMSDLGLKSRTNIIDGLKETYSYYLNNRDMLR